MTKLPVKVLLDENKKPFVPYMTTDTVFYGDTDKTVSETLDAAVKEVTDLSESVTELSKEVNAKIETVFTYKGNVANYNALQQIVNPSVGDVYNALDTDKNYAWNGSKWDDLGGIVDLSDYCTEDRMLYIIEEHSKILGDMLTNQMNNALLEYYTKDEVETLVDDALSNAEVSVDLSDYYTKEEVDVRIPNINTTALLKTAGHVDTVEELPSVSQPSGKFGEHPSVLAIDYTKTDVEFNIADLPNLTTMLGIETPYVFGFYVDRENYFFVSTDNPELIDGFSYSLDGNFNIYTNQGTSPDTNFKVYHACYNGMFNTMLPAGDPDGYALFLPDMGTAVADFNAGVEYAAMCIPPPPIMGDHTQGIAMTYLGGKGPFRIFGNLPNTIKYRPHLRYALKTVDGNGAPPISWEYLPEDATRDSLTLAFANNYTYTDGMEALRFDEQGNAYWITDADGAKENDVATVGDNNAIYVNEPGKGWTPWAKQKEDVVTLVEAPIIVEDVLTTQGITPVAFAKPRGHVATEDDLPSLGQASGEVKDTPATLNTDLTQIRPELARQTSNNYMLYFDLGVDSWSPADASTDAYLKLETAYPETITHVGFSPNGYAMVKIEATSSKPVTVSMRRVITSKVLAATSSGGTPSEYSSSVSLTGTYYIWSQLQVKGIYGNLSTVVKNMNHDTYAHTISQSNGSRSSVKGNYSNSVQLAFRDDKYVYNTDMQMLKFDEDYNAYWVTAEPQAAINDTFTVGDSNAIYVCEEGYRWRNWGKSSGGGYKLYSINLSKPATGGGSTDISGSGTTVINKIMEAAAEGKTPVIYSSNYSGLFFPLFSLDDVKTRTYFDFCGPTFAQYNSSNTGQVGMPYARFNVKTNDNGNLTYNANSIGAGQLQLLNTSYFLSLSNTKAFTPTDDYQPATKKYVDDAIAAALANLTSTE